MAAVHGAVALGQQALDRAALQLLLAAAEHAAGTRVGQHDATFGVDHEHAIGVGVEQPTVQVGQRAALRVRALVMAAWRDRA